MSSIRLEEKPFELDGKTYVLRCNMAVLDALQEGSDGDFGAVMSMPARQGVVEILAAMLNDYAEDMDWPDRWTAKQLKKRFSYAYLLELDILGMFTRAVIPTGAGAPEKTEDKRSFWKTMNPARLWALFDAHFRPAHRSGSSESLQTGKKRGKSLSQYLTGGG